MMQVLSQEKEKKKKKNTKNDKPMCLYCGSVEKTLGAGFTEGAGLEESGKRLQKASKF